MSIYVIVDDVSLKAMAVVQHVLIYVSVPWACCCLCSVEYFWMMCDCLSPTAHLQSGHPTTEMAQSIVESPGWIQGWHIIFDNHWKTVQWLPSLLDFLFSSMHCWQFRFSTQIHPMVTLWLTGTLLFHYQGRCSSVTGKNLADDLIIIKMI